MQRVSHSFGTAAACLLLISSPAFAAKGDLIDPRKIHDSINVSLGQEFTIVFDQRGDRLVNPRRAQGANSRPGVTVKFSVFKRDVVVQLLVVGSSYPRIVRYRAAARTLTQREFRETNMLPLNPNVPVWEGWPDPFVELFLFDFHLTNEKPPKTA